MSGVDVADRLLLLISYINVLYRSYAYDNTQISYQKRKRGTEERTPHPPKVHSLRKER